MANSLLVLLDDIATLLDDVAVLSKVAAKKTAGVLGDDLALNAEQVAGVKAERELPVIWAVAKGSFLNKFILVPAALAISAFVPWLITPLLMIGGAFLCFEGFEKVFHKWFHSKEERKVEHEAKIKAVADPKVDMVEFEKKKIKGAIRTDFILSAEIIVITLGAVTAANAPFLTQVLVLSSMAIAITIGIYAIVAGIVRLDDFGAALAQKASSAKQAIGKAILVFAPYLMKTLSIVGTIAMFLVGGDILLHGVPDAHHYIDPIVDWAKSLPTIGGVFAAIVPTLSAGLFGFIVGGILVAIFSVFMMVYPKKAADHG